MSRVADHWWWRPGWSTGHRFYTVHATFGGAPEVQVLAAEAARGLPGCQGWTLCRRSGCT